MADNSKIEWTNASWNPIRARNLKTGKVGWHCEHATTGCEHCYSEGFNKRLGTGLAFKPGHRKDIEIFLDEQMLTQPLRWKKPRKIFVCSMTDAFADFVTDAMLDKMFAVMALCPQHTFQVLTKRAKRMREYFGRHRWHIWAKIGRDMDSRRWNSLPDIIGGDRTPIPNVWLGVSAERQPEADERIPELIATPAAVRFVSLEPLLGHIALHALNLGTRSPSNALRGVQCVPDDSAEGFHNAPTAKLDMVIVGGESGSRARIMAPAWPRSLRDWCASTGTAFFFKQWGMFAPVEISVDEFCNPTDAHAGEKVVRDDGELGELPPFNRERFHVMRRMPKAAAGRLLDGVEHNEFPRTNPSEDIHAVR